MARPHALEGLTPVVRLRVLGLTARETDVGLLASRGLLVREIGQHLQIAPGTVKALLARAREKLGCRNVRELTALLIHHGVIQPDELLMSHHPLENLTSPLVRPANACPAAR